MQTYLSQVVVPDDNYNYRYAFTYMSGTEIIADEAFDSIYAPKISSE